MEEEVLFPNPTMSQKGKPGYHIVVLGDNVT